MPDSPGTQLRKAREARGISREEAAHATKIRVPRLAELEADDYSKFANLVYAKNFLALYADYLGVDLKGYLESITQPTNLSLEGYGYLTDQPHTEIIARRPRDRRQPLFLRRHLFGASIVLGALVLAGLWWYVNVNLERLDLKGPSSPTPKTTLPATPASNVALTPTPSPVVSPSPAPAEESGVPGSPPSEPEIRRAMPGPGSTPLSGVPPAVDLLDGAPKPEYEVSVRATSRTWVKVTKNERGNSPAYDYWLDPEDEPLVFRGRRFWISARDPGAVDIRRNGQPVPAVAPELTLE